MLNMWNLKLCLMKKQISTHLVLIRIWSAHTSDSQHGDVCAHTSINDSRAMEKPHVLALLWTSSCHKSSHGALLTTSDQFNPSHSPIMQFLKTAIYMYLSTVQTKYVIIISHMWVSSVFCEASQGHREKMKLPCMCLSIFQSSFLCMNTLSF